MRPTEQAPSFIPYATYPDGSAHNEAHSSGVSWSAVIAGAFVTAALSLILLALGTGLGLSSVSPFSNVGLSASTLGASAIVWLIVMEIISSSLGGYLAGRLRTKWASIHSDEVYFRDTAHGFLAWATALVVTAAFLASAATVMIGSPGPSTMGPKSGSNVQSEEGQRLDPNAYFVDTMFRTDAAKSDAIGNSVLNEAGVIFANALRQGTLPPADKTYLDQLVSTKTGMTQSDADKRVSDVFASAQEAAETTRRAVAHSLLWTFLALLIGAFCASLSATIGGGQRDRVVVV
jgi:hypothetical protein